MNVFTVIEFPMTGPLTQPGMVGAPWVESFEEQSQAKESIEQLIRDILKAKGDTAGLLQFAAKGLIWFDAQDADDIMLPEGYNTIYGLAPMIGVAYVVTETVLQESAPKLEIVH